MKSKFFLLISIVTFSVMLFSCQSSGTNDKKVATLETVNPDVKKLKDQIVEIIMALPDNQETVKLINETGAAYIAGLTLENIIADNILTRASTAKAYGGVLFDMAYANTYNQVNTFSKLLDINESLVRKLGFEEFLNQNKELKKRYQDNKDDQAAVDQIVGELMSKSNDYIQENGSASDISLVFAGATTKSLFVISNITLFAMNNDKLVDLMKNQKSRIESAYKILQLSGDSGEVKKMAEALKPIMEIYDSADPFNENTVEKIRQLTSFVME